LAFFFEAKKEKKTVSLAKIYFSHALKSLFLFMKKTIYFFVFWQISHLILAQNLIDNAFFADKNIKKQFIFGLNEPKQKEKTRIPLFQPAKKAHKGRLIGLSTTAAVTYSSTMLAVGQLWYADYEQTRFHFFNDNGEWNQIDKVGHS